MLYILIPCLLLLIIAIVLKKRESENSKAASNPDKKSVQKKVSKNTSARVSRATTSQTKVTAPPTVTETTPTSLDTEVRTHIEQLIKAENYFAAEAKINQLLNQNNVQHELYLYLLDIHVAQDDNFAIKKLISHLRSLGLHDIADQAEVKQQITATAQTTLPAEIIDQAFKAAKKKASLAADQDVKSSNAFDELINNPSNNNQQTNHVPTGLSQTLTNTFKTETKVTSTLDQPEKNDLPPIEYSFKTSESTVKNQTVRLDPVEPETSSDHFTPHVEAIEKESVEFLTKETPTIEISPLEFNFSTLVTPDEKANINSVNPVENFVFKDNSTTENNVEQPTLEFKLDTKLPDQVDFHFSLDTPITADTNSLIFETQKVALVPAEKAPEIDPHEQIHSNDPLAQSFPDLLKVNEIQLNFDLADRYITLGAYDSAKKLLTTDALNFSTEQRERAQMLLNKIAS